MIRVEYYWRTIEVKAEPEEIPDTEHELCVGAGVRGRCR